MICIPELNCWLGKLYFEAAINEGKFCFPSYITLSDWGVENSVINLLFNECTTQTSYDYLFRRIAFSSISNSSLQMRLSIVRSETEAASIYVCDNYAFETLYADSTSYNCLQITEEETTLLDELLYYRVNGTHDSTSFVNITYENLQSNLSKMIYLYIILMVDQDISLYNNSETLSDDNRMIEVCFEKYLIDTYYKVISKKYLKLDSTSNIQIEELKCYCGTITLSSTDISQKRIMLPYTPVINENTTLIIEGVCKRYETDFIIIDESGIFYLSWADLDLDGTLFENDRMFIIYSYFN